MEYSDDELNQADFYGVDPAVIRRKMTQNEKKQKEHRILIMEDGRLRSKVVTTEELKELNTPKFSTHKGKYDSERKRYGSHFKVRNTIFGNV